jgi:6-pyruvoyltetrahydropterin/6-carboxytetrahydropterin synthase
MVVESQISAAHAIRNYPGPCCHLHGHNYRVKVRLTGEELDQLGMLIDYADVKRVLAQVLDHYDHTNLNDLPDFADVNPTSEELARIIYHQLREALLTTEELRRRITLAEVVVFESERQGVGYREE